MEQKRFYNIDFLKFLCCITILIVHLSLINLKMPYIGRTDIGVTFFFILSGFFLYFSFAKKISLVDFVAKRWIRLMPIVLASVLGVILLHKTGLIAQHTHFKDVFLTTFFIRNMALFNDGTQIKFDYDNSHLWFIGPLFWCSLFYFALFKSTISHSVKCLITAVIVYCGCVADIHVYVPKIPGTYGVWRGLSGIGMGLLCAMIAEYFVQNPFKGFSLKRKWIFTLGEVFFFGLFIHLMFIDCLPKKFHFYGMVVFFVLTLLFYFQKGSFSQWLNQPWLGKLGTISYSVYVLQYIPQILVAKSNKIGSMASFIEWKTHYPVAVILLVGIMAPVILGGGYILIEKPATEYLTRLWKKLKGNENENH